MNENRNIADGRQPADQADVVGMRVRQPNLRNVGRHKPESCERPDERIPAFVRVGARVDQRQPSVLFEQINVRVADGVRRRKRNPIQRDVLRRSAQRSDDPFASQSFELPVIETKHVSINFLVMLPQ